MNLRLHKLNLLTRYNIGHNGHSVEKRRGLRREFCFFATAHISTKKLEDQHEFYN